MAELSFVKIGDRIVLQSEEAQGFLSSTGMNHPNFYVQKQQETKLALVPNQRNLVFRLYPKLNYNVARDYDKLQAKLTGNASAIKNNKQLYHQFLERLRVFEQRKQSEQANNELHFCEQQGEYIYYGLSIQLMHEASGQFLQLSKQSAEQDKTCQKLELTYSPVASRVTFQIQPRYKYRQEGDQVVFNDQILLYNQKYSAYIHFSKDLLKPPIPDFQFQSDFRPNSPLRRRNPENLFSWYEANVSQNYEKFTIQAYQHTDVPANEEYYLYGGDIIRIKHAESGGYLTVDDSKKDQDRTEGYIRIQTEADSDDHTTYHQLFEIEKVQEELAESGSPLQWEEDQDNGCQSVRVRLRHFISGRLLQVCLYKNKQTISQILTLASGQRGQLEKDGEGISSKKILKKANRIQNYVFKLTNRATVDELNLTRDTVANISNEGTKTFISTDNSNLEDPEENEEQEVEEEQIDLEQEDNLNKTIDNLAIDDVKSIIQSEKNLRRRLANEDRLGTVATDVIENALNGKIGQMTLQIPSLAKNVDDSAISDAASVNMNSQKNSEKSQFMDKEKVYRPIKHDPSSDYIIESKIILRNRADMNDVFVPIKCSLEEIKCVLYMQSSVPKIKQFLSYAREKNTERMNLPFFLGIQELLKDVIFFLVDEKGRLVDPMTIEGEPLKSRQKAMRECRFIDLLIDCLIYPFADGLYRYDDLTSQHPITKICRLIYRLLKLSVKENSMNKNYVAQWIDLFFTQAMSCTDQNSFFAETAIHELIRDNPRLLENQIEKTTIENLVKLCLQQPLHERFLNLLAGLCSCNSRAITSNQDYVFETILEDESIKRKLFFEIKQEYEKGELRNMVSVRDDMNQDKIQKVAIEDLFSFYQDKGDLRLYNYFQSLIKLSASICFMRNYKSIQALEEVFTIDQVIDCVLNEKMPSLLRASFCDLLITLHLDKDPLETLVVPIMTRVWDDIEQGTLETPISNAMIHPKLLELKPALSKFIKSTNGLLIASLVEFNHLILKMLNVLETMIGLGFYNSNEELIEVTKPLIQILNGQFDLQNEEEKMLYDKQVEETGDESIPLFRDEESQKDRYARTPQNMVIMEIKDKIIDISKILMSFQNNTRLSMFLNDFGLLEKKGGLAINKYCQIYQQAINAGNFKQFEHQLRQQSATQEEICDNVNEWVRNAYNERSLDLQTVSLAEGSDFSCILLELNLYDNPKLVSNVFQLLIAQYSQKLNVFDLANDVQILQDAEEIAILNACNITLREMKKDAESCEFWLGKSDDESLKMSRSFIDRQTGLVDLCIYNQNRVLDLKDDKKNEDHEFEFLNLSEFRDQWDDEDRQVCKQDTLVDEQNQRLLRNLRAYESALTIIHQKTLKNAPNKNAYLKVLEKAYTFLIMFVKKNNENQNIVLKYIDAFLGDLEYGVHALELIKEIFTDNENLMEYPLVPLMRRLAIAIDSIEKESMKKATLISFIPQFMCYRGEYQRHLQYLILSEFTSSARKNSNQLYVGERGLMELAIQMEEMRDSYESFMHNPSLVAEIEMPPEMCYSMMYIRLIAMSGMGKNVQCETRAQALLPMKDLIQNMDLADFCYPLKSSILLFLEQIYLDTEKEIGEDFTNQVWGLISRLEKDLLKFVEVMQKQKRQSNGISRKNMLASTSAAGGSQMDLTEMLMNGTQGGDFMSQHQIDVDVSKNFNFVTNFGSFKISELMQEYVFEGIFPCLNQFFSLRLPMKEEQKELVRRLLKICLMCTAFKSKPIHEKIIVQLVTGVRNNPVLQDIANQLNMNSANVNPNGSGGDVAPVHRGGFLSPAQKLKVFMQTCRTDDTKKAQIAKEFEELVLYIINIDIRTEIAFKGANTIKNEDFIQSLIISTDVTSSIPSELRTSSLVILRKIIESENKGEASSNSSQWDTDDWISYEGQIVERQTMLNNLGVVPLLCRILAKETKRAILEEAILVSIADLLGGNNQSQQLFHEYIVKDHENGFMRKIFNMMSESFEVIKKKSIKRNTKMSKIQILEIQLEELHPEDEEYSKLMDQKKLDEELIKDTEYVEDEERVGETLTFSRAIDNMTIYLRFVQLLCENHNLDLQKILCIQHDTGGKKKQNQFNIIQLMARMFEQYQKIINSVTISIGHGIVDAITESVQGPCKENQHTLTQAKILDSSREFIANFDDKGQVGALGFAALGESDDEDEDDPIEVLDEFIQKIATMVVSLLEGEEDIEILQRMNFSLQMSDLKNRMLNVFGNFLIKLKLFPFQQLTKEQQEEDNINLVTLSDASKGEFLINVSVNRITSRLSKDSFEGNISEAFEIYNLLQKLSDGLPAAGKHLMRDSFTSDQYKVFDFLRQHTGRIEVAVDNQLQRVYFPIRPVCNLIPRKVKKAIMLSIDRESQQQKVGGLMGHIPGLIDEMEQNYKLQNARIKITPQLMMDLKDFSTVVGAMISSIQLFTLSRVDHYRTRSVPDIVEKVITILGLIQGASSGLLVGFYIINRFQIVTKAKWRNFIKANKQIYKVLPNNQRLSVDEMSIEMTHLILMVNGPESIEFNINKEETNFGNFFTRMEFRLINLYFFLQDASFQYYILYFCISVLGFLSDELFYSLQLLDVVVRFPSLTDVVKAVTLNTNKLLSTGLLAMVIIYIFTTISFFYLQDTLYDYAINAFDSDWVGENMCESMFQCYLTIIDKGLTLGGGIGDYTEQINYRDETAKYFVKLGHDAMFHILVKVILLNILFGIIIDTFAKMREQKKFLQMDTENVCFICNTNRFIFDKMCEGGFDRHVSKDHNLWYYVFYIVHLVSKDPTEMTGIESYVFEMYNKDDLNWLPRNNALVINQLEQDEEQGEDELTKAVTVIETYSQKMDEFNNRLASLTMIASKQKKSSQR